MNALHRAVGPPPALQQLRVTFPQWAFLYNPFARRWVAVRARHPTITTHTPEELARHVGRYEPRQGRPAAVPRR